MLAVGAKGDDQGFEDFRSVGEFLRKLKAAGMDGDSEIETLRRQVRETMETPGWKHIAHLLRLEREQHVRMMAGKVLEHAEYAHKGGMVKGLAAPMVIASMVEGIARGVRTQLAREAAESSDGES